MIQEYLNSVSSYNTLELIIIIMCQLSYTHYTVLYYMYMCMQLNVLTCTHTLLYNSYYNITIVLLLSLLLCVLLHRIY